jgi:hypothetical protein
VSDIPISDVNDIDPFTEDVLLFKFTQIDPSDPSCEFQFVLDVSDRMYKGRPRSPTCVRMAKPCISAEM